MNVVIWTDSKAWVGAYDSLTRNFDTKSWNVEVFYLMVSTFLIIRQAELELTISSDI